jgi:hypothetical protein
MSAMPVGEPRIFQCLHGSEPLRLEPPSGGLRVSAPLPGDVSSSRNERSKRRFLMGQGGTRPHAF